MLINQIMSMINICKPKKKEKKKSVILDLLNNPDDFRLEMYTENEEVVIKIRRNEKKEDESKS